MSGFPHLLHPPLESLYSYYELGIPIFMHHFQYSYLSDMFSSAVTVGNAISDISAVADISSGDTSVDTSSGLFSDAFSGATSDTSVAVSD